MSTPFRFGRDCREKICAQRVKLPQRAFSFLQQALVDSGRLILNDASFDLPSRQVALSAAQQSQVDALLLRLKQQGTRPETDPKLDADLLEYLEGQHLIMRLKGGVNLDRTVYDQMVAETRALLEAQERATLADIRDRLETSRKNRAGIPRAPRHNPDHSSSRRCSSAAQGVGTASAATPAKVGIGQRRRASAVKPVVRRDEPRVALRAFAAASAACRLARGRQSGWQRR